MNLGATIKRLRKKRGMSISGLAVRTGIAKSQLSLLERGIQRNPTLDTIIKLSIGLDAHIAEVLSLRMDTVPKHMLSPPPVVHTEHQTVQ